jgi:DNA primase
MNGRIPENVLEDILTRVDLAELISSYIPLKKAGRNFKACCPFHHEKTPSFMVSPDRQIYHCFGCGESGNAFKFLMRYERMDFPEAVELLAKKAGIVLVQENRPASGTEGLVTQLFKVNEYACNFYSNNLTLSDASIARDYLVKRGVKQETMQYLKLGFSLNRWDGLINYLRAKSIAIGLLEKAGLVIAKEGGGYYDRFRSRIVFPIFDIKGRVLGFGGRVLDGSTPKYLNSPETSIYIKGRNLYGLNFAKDSIRDNDFVAVVEGYLDFTIPYQEGLKNIVASLGTALTVDQARLLKRYTHNVVMVYDSDSAGELATLRSLDIFIEEEMSVKIVTLPKGFDPDLFVRKNGIEAFREKISKAQDVFDYKLGVLKQRYNSKEIEGKAKISSLMLETIVKYKNAVLRSEYLRKLAQELGIKEEALLEETKKTKPERTVVLSTDSGNKTKDVNPTEKLLMSLMLEENTLIDHIKNLLEPKDFQDERISKIVSIMFELVEQGKSVHPQLLMHHLGDDVSELVCESAFLPQGLTHDHKEKVVNDCVKRMKNEIARQKRERLHEQIKIAQHSGDEDRLTKLMNEFQLLIKEKAVKL